MTTQPRGWNALADTITSARQLDRLVSERNFTRNELRAATDQLADNLAAWMTMGLNRDPDDIRATSGPMLSAEGRVELRGILEARWSKGGSA